MLTMLSLKYDDAAFLRADMLTLDESLPTPPHCSGILGVIVAFDTAFFRKGAPVSVAVGRVN